jgi:adenylate cyclase
MKCIDHTYSTFNFHKTLFKETCSKHLDEDFSMTDTSFQPPILTILDESGEVLSSVTLDGKTTFHIGRSEENDIILPFNWVSRQHAMLQADKSGALNLIDLGSTNGTFVNDRRITTPTLLHSGNRLAIGRTIMVFHQETPARKARPEREENDTDRTVSYARKKLVTILVSDIHGFTRLAESVGDRRVSKLLQAWSPRVSTIIRTHDGMVDKFLGDAVMAVWIGGDVAGNVRQALATALAIDRFTNELGMKMTGIGQRLTTGGAINTGEAFVGNMGSDSRRDFTAIGDVVNVTFRLEGLTALTGMDVLLGEGSALHVQGEDLPLRHSRHLLKGKEDEIAAYGCRFTDLAKWLDAETVQRSG